MRLLPLQIEMYVLAGVWYDFWGPEMPLSDRLREARQSLVEQTGQDFGFDIRRWHDYLVENQSDEYCWSNKHRSIAARIREAEADPLWRDAIAALKSDVIAVDPSPHNQPLQRTEAAGIVSAIRRLLGRGPGR